VRLGFSNVAWYPGRTDEFLDLVGSLGVEGVELATSMVWDEPVESTPEQRRALRESVEARGMGVTGLQALLYTHQEIQVFRSGEDRAAALEYLTHLMDLCADLGGEVLVFGSPRNRRIGALDPTEARAIAAEFFGELGRRACERGVFFCIEPLGREETDFVNTVADAEALIADAGAPAGLGLHIDAKALIEEHEYDAPYLTESFSRAKHVHVNDPGLTGPGTTGFDHGLIRARMEGSGYDRFVSVEMRRTREDPEGAIRRAVDYVRRVYLSA
jgi:D-psicose/D-tagatose/L-ribulose 3-epimerase